MSKLRVIKVLFLILTLLATASAEQLDLEQRLRDITHSVELQDDRVVRKGSLLHLRLVPMDQGVEVLSTHRMTRNPPMMNRFYLYAYRYASNANLIAIPIPEVDNLQTEAHRQIRRMNEPLMESLLKSALGRAAGEFVLNDAFDQDTLNWAQAPSITAEGFRQRIEPGVRFNVRGSLRGVGAGIRYNVAGISISTAYSTQNEGMDPVRFSMPFSSDWNRGEFGVDTQGNVWLNFVGRW